MRASFCQWQGLVLPVCSVAAALQAWGHVCNAAVHLQVQSMMEIICNETDIAEVQLEVSTERVAAVEVA